MENPGAQLSSVGEVAILAGVTALYVPLRNLTCFTMLEGAMEPKTIAERAATLGFPAIALTAYGRCEDRLHAITAGFSMHVPKPVNMIHRVLLLLSKRWSKQ